MLLSLMFPVCIYARVLLQSHTNNPITPSLIWGSCCLFIVVLNTEFTVWWLVSHLALDAQVLYCSCFYLTNISTVVLELQLKELFSAAFSEDPLCVLKLGMRGNQLTKALCLTSFLLAQTCIILHLFLRYLSDVILRLLLTFCSHCCHHVAWV